MSKRGTDKFLDDYDKYHCSPDIIEDTEEALDKYGYGYGAEVNLLKPKHIKALMEGKCLAFSDGEYHHFLIYADQDDEGS